MTTIPSIENTYITMICDAFVAMEDVISDAELGGLIIGSGIQDLHSNASRQRRLYAAFLADQEHFRCADNLATFLHRTGFHIKKSRGQAAFKRYTKEMNQVLSFVGYELNDESEIKELDRTKTSYVPPEAEERAKQFREVIKQQKFHPDIEMICRAEYFVEKGYFRACRESMRSLIEKIKAKSVLGHDGPELAEHAFSFAWPGKPILAINAFMTEADIAEQFSFMVLLKAYLLMFQDEQTRAYRPSWEISLEDALNLLNLASYFHRKVDKAKKQIPVAAPVPGS